jgi:hypothetical protein
MLQVFYMDVTKVDRDVAYVAMFERHVASVSGLCCKHLFKYFICLQTYVTSVFYPDIVHVSHICCKSMFECFNCFSLMLQ